jgi:hypothetical protein
MRVVVLFFCMLVFQFVLKPEVNAFCIPYHSEEEIHITDTVYKSAHMDTMAYFSGSDPGIIKYLKDSCRLYPSTGASAIVTFVISSSGNTENAQITYRRGALTPQEEAEALRLILDMPDWKPAWKHGRKVAMEMALPVFIHWK